MMLIVYYSPPSISLLCIPSSHPIISHTGSVLSTNPPHLSPHLSISSLNHIPTTISLYGTCSPSTLLLSVYVQPLISCHLLPLSVYTTCIYTIRFDLQLTERRRCAALLMLCILSGARTQNNNISYLLSTIPTPADVYRRLIGPQNKKRRCIIHPSSHPVDKDFATAASSAQGTASVNMELANLSWWPRQEAQRSSSSRG